MRGRRAERGGLQAIRDFCSESGRKEPQRGFQTIVLWKGSSLHILWRFTRLVSVNTGTDCIYAFQRRGSLDRNVCAEAQPGRLLPSLVVPRATKVGSGSVLLSWVSPCHDSFTSHETSPFSPFAHSSVLCNMVAIAFTGSLNPSTGENTF